MSNDNDLSFSVDVRPNRTKFIAWTDMSNKICRLRKAFDGEDKRLSQEELKKWKDDYQMMRNQLDNLYIESVKQIISRSQQ